MSEVNSKKLNIPETAIPKLFGNNDRYIKIITRILNTSVSFVGGELSITGGAADVAKTVELLQYLHGLGREFSTEEMQTALTLVQSGDLGFAEEFENDRVAVSGGLKYVLPKTRNQRLYINAIKEKDMVFAYGPAGTGKTFLAVAMAVNMYLDKKVRRIILTRPAVEAGEKLGFLPGDLADKINPYLRPLHDALQSMMDPEAIIRLVERNIIEVAPLAFMRGRTLSNAFVILDEAQNTTKAQMKMFLTRLGFGSKVVITGDTTQVDLPVNTDSGLTHAIETLKDLEEIAFLYLSEKDMVRHPLVTKIVGAYETIG
ncbi:MAG: PhoH family protein [Deferribacteraceae bacterium]|jgi:phosphate starvation-inducible PhoH-like protein|nr:PhoH family protein [Deferribacteraceae bacterium]